MKKRLLIVDDSKLMHAQMRQMLANSDFEIVGCVSSGEQALQLLQTAQADLVSLDVILPGIDGMDTAKLILEHWPSVRIVFVTYMAYDETMRDAKQIGASEVIYKPFDQESLLAAYTRALDGPQIP